jgi:hypothetical protein
MIVDHADLDVGGRGRSKQQACRNQATGQSGGHKALHGVSSLEVAEQNAYAFLVSASV